MSHLFTHTRKQKKEEKSKCKDMKYLEAYLLHYISIATLTHILPIVVKLIRYMLYQVECFDNDIRWLAGIFVLLLRGTRFRKSSDSVLSLIRNKNELESLSFFVVFLMYLDLEPTCFLRFAQIYSQTLPRAAFHKIIPTKWSIVIPGNRTRGNSRGLIG